MVIVEIAAGYEGIEKSGGEKAKQQLGWLLLYSDWSLLILRREGEREREKERERESDPPRADLASEREGSFSSSVSQEIVLVQDNSPVRSETTTL